jgi:hypothetical protein
MGHAVHYRTAAGESRFEDVPSLEAAVELVERLRNEDGAEAVRVFREIPLEVRTYYKVVVAGDGGALPEVVPAPAVRQEPVSDEPPPGAMNLSPPPATASMATVPALEDDGEQPRRNSLFNRG